MLLWGCNWFVRKGLIRTKGTSPVPLFCIYPWYLCIETWRRCHLTLPKPGARKTNVWISDLLYFRTIRVQKFQIWYWPVDFTCARLTWFRYILLTSMYNLYDTLLLFCLQIIRISKYSLTVAFFFSILKRKMTLSQHDIGYFPVRRVCMISVVLVQNGSAILNHLL